METVAGEDINFLTVHSEPMRLHSGDASRFRVNAEGLFDNERIREVIIADWVRFLTLYHPRSRFHIIGIPEGGTPWAVELWRVLEIDKRGENTFNKSTDHIHPAEKPSKVILVDDVLTTGHSLIEVVEGLRKNQFPTVALIVIDRRWQLDKPHRPDPVWAVKAGKHLPIASWTRMPLPTERS